MSATFVAERVCRHQRAARRAGARLTLAGLEVEHIDTIGDEWEKIYIGQVATLEQHPNADRLPGYRGVRRRRRASRS